MKDVIISSMDMGVLVALYAAVVGTISLVWNITKIFYDEKTRIKVKCKPIKMLIDDPNTNLQSNTLSGAKINIINDSKTDVFVNNIYI